MHLGNLSHSGAGLLIIEATAVLPEGRISPQDLGLWNDETEQALATTVNAVKKYSSMPLGIQLGHAGRKASTAVPWQGRARVSEQQGGWHPVSPSALPYDENDTPPIALTTQQIADVVTAFVNAAQRADRIGFDVFEIHAAHGYLLHQFLSPLSNQRDNRYGGNLDNRMRLVLEVFRAVREVLPRTQGRWCAHFCDRWRGRRMGSRAMRCPQPGTACRWLRFYACIQWRALPGTAYSAGAELSGSIC